MGIAAAKECSVAYEQQQVITCKSDSRIINSGQELVSETLDIRVHL